MYSFHMSEKQSLPHHPKKVLRKSERLKRRKKITLIAVSSFLLLCVAYSSLLLHEVTHFQTVTVTESALSQKVKHITEDKLQTDYWGFIPFNSFITPSFTLLEEGLRRDVPELKEVYISRSFTKRDLHVSYSLRTPVFLLADGRYLDVNMVKYADDRKPSLPVLTFVNAFSTKELQKLIFLKETIESALSDIDFVDINVENDVVFTLATPHKTKILFSLKQDEKEVWSKIVSALDVEPLKSDKDSFKETLSIDARFGNKIYYKLYVEHGYELPTSTATTTYTRE